jgi:hypothetical protein
LWTPALWQGIPWDEIQAGTRDGWVFFDDFINMPALGEADAADTKYASYGDGGTTIQQAADFKSGAVAITLDGGDNDEGSIQTGGNTGGFAEFIRHATGAPHIIAMEARVKKSVITAGTAMFVGLADPGSAAADLMVDDTGAMKDANWLGFHATQLLSTTDMTFSYRANGQAVQDLISDVHTLVADTFVKVGFLYDYRNAALRQISAWVDGVIQSTYVTKTLMDAATFPGTANDEMAPILGAKSHIAVAQTLSADWWRIAVVPTGL